MAKPTWKMSETELARVWANHNGIEGKPGGWLYLNGKPICQGWFTLGRFLARRGIIEVGKGVHWMRSTQMGNTKILNQLPRRYPR